MTVGLDREQLLAVYRAAVAACDPATRVREGLAEDEVATVLDGRRRFGVAVGKAALAMATGAGPVERGVVIVPAGSVVEGDARETSGIESVSTELPSGWYVIASAHPFVDERSVHAARAARAVVDAADEGDVVLALISGGASALIEEPIDGLSIEELGATTRAVMEAGASIEELNTVRSALSRIKRGGLVAACRAPCVTLAVSDVIGDGLAIIGSGPTIGSWARAQDVARIVASMAAFGEAAVRALGRQMWLEHAHAPLVGDVADCAKRIVERAGVSEVGAHGTFVFWGEPTLRVPEDHGEGGRAQQLALILAKAIRGTKLVAMAIGSDGMDGPPPAHRSPPAGAIVDGSTWDAILAGGQDPESALARCDAGTVLDAVGALVVTGPTGINHGDLVVIGERRG